MNSDLKTAFITGGAQGIGRAIAERLRIDGFQVAITDRRPAPAGDYLALRLDIAKEMDVRHGIGGRLDVPVNNAGISDPRELHQSGMDCARS